MHRNIGIMIAYPWHTQSSNKRKRITYFWFPLLHWLFLQFDKKRLQNIGQRKIKLAVWSHQWRALTLLQEKYHYSITYYVILIITCIYSKLLFKIIDNLRMTLSGIWNFKDFVSKLNMGEAMEVEIKAKLTFNQNCKIILFCSK